MEKSTKYYLSLFGFFTYSLIFAQVNCAIFTDKICKKSCEISNKVEPFEWNLWAQEAFDVAIKLCPQNDYAYREKSVPFLKVGDFICWKLLIDKAVEINPKENLGYRGWCKFQFFRDYDGALQDFEELEKIYPNNLGSSQNGNYDLYFPKAFCQDALGNTSQAISTIERAMSRPNYNVGNYDFYQLGALYFKIGDYEKALKNFEKQSAIVDFAENIYFKAKISKIRNKDYLDLKNLALRTYDEGQTMKDTYTHHYNKIYRKQIAEL